MPEITFVDKENADGLIAGSQYNSSVRIMARSPSGVVFNALGVRYWNRKDGSSFQDVKIVVRDRPTKAGFVAARDAIDRFMGAGVGDAVIQAWKEGKTVLVDGGGEKLRLPRTEQRIIDAQALAAVSINKSISIEDRVPTCKQCAKPLQPKFTVHRMGRDILPDHPRSWEDCQRMSNFEVVAIRGYKVTEGPKVGFVESFDTWDGQSTFDPHFCGDTCAASYGRRAAEAHPPLGPSDPVPKPGWRHDSVDHFEPAPAREMILDGKVFKF
ncbi:hypothetical protein CcrColossus_gp258 [Caulobacter phage CcrColossus]|uniref:Uncharacterized protein n=1 Tax=Caulobacter phage CcrColossus TaxID=1211640 RepID=K4JW61_9CAUD|nr:hypothetical protein CcrColossus_gp258 [Caulobacter phage CcrColossus]AFU88128.1 hypothetical protein CcrColossus_gp258 [Caulobacter phage CcrColossus]